MKVASLRHNAFCRVIINEEFVDIYIVKFNIVIEKKTYKFDEIAPLLDRLRAYQWPLEIVVNHFSMNCRALSIVDLTKQNIENLKTNILKSKKNNTIMSYIDRINAIKNLYIIECDLTEKMCSIIQSIFNLKLKILSFTAMPCWLISSLRLNHQIDMTHYSCQVVIIKYQEYYHIVVVNYSKIICNRICYARDLNLKEEIKNTLVHIKLNYNIDLNDVAIYEYDDGILDALWQYNNINMTIMSSIFKFNNYKQEVFVNKMIKIIGGGMLIGLAVSNAKTCVELIEIKNNIEYKKQFISNNKIDDLEVWTKLHEMNSINQPDYYIALTQYSGTNKHKLQNVYMKWNENQIYCSEVQE